MIKILVNNVPVVVFDIVLEDAMRMTDKNYKAVVNFKTERKLTDYEREKISQYIGGLIKKGEK